MKASLSFEVGFDDLVVRTSPAYGSPNSIAGDVLREGSPPSAFRYTCSDMWQAYRQTSDQPLVNGCEAIKI